jgi:hypothetical protein
MIPLKKGDPARKGILWLLALGIVGLLFCMGCATTPPRIPAGAEPGQVRTYTIEHRIFGVPVWKTTATLKGSRTP